MNRRIAVCCLLGWCGLATPGGLPAQDGSLIERARLQRELAENRLEAETIEALRDAERLFKVKPEESVKRLKVQQFQVDKSLELSAPKRAKLTQMIQAKLAQYEGRPAVATPVTTPNPLSPEELKALKAAAATETKEIQEAIQEIARLYDQNQFAQAQRKISDISQKYPNNPATIALSGQGYVNDRVSEARELSRQQAERIQAALVDVDRSALPARGDIEFPKGWAEKMEKRDKLLGVALDPETERILERLELPVKPGQGIKGGSFEAAIQSLSTIMQKDIFLNTDALRDAGVDLTKPVTLPDGVSVRTALRAVLQANGLTFVIKDQSIVVLRPEEAKKLLVKRAYYIGDVLSSPLGGGATFGPLVDFNIASQNAQLIIDAIKRGIDPLGWAGQGGDASIYFHAPSLSLIVSAPAEVHYDIHRATRGRK